MVIRFKVVGLRKRWGQLSYKEQAMGGKGTDSIDTERQAKVKLVIRLGIGKEGVKQWYEVYK